MTDVRLTATNPEDSSVVPVACNEKGELKLEEPVVSSDDYVAKAGDTMTGNLHLGDHITLDAIDGSAEFTGTVNIGDYSVFGTGDGFRFAKGGQININRQASGTVLQVSNNGGIDPTVVIKADGSAEFAGGIKSTVGNAYAFEVSDGTLNLGGIYRNSSGTSFVVKNNVGTTNAQISPDGSAAFAGDVIVGSRNKQWMIVESNGLAHLVEQTRSEISTADVEPSIDYPPLRDIPGELTMVEEQLQKVLEKLRMVPEAGWEVWDGSDEN